MKKFPFIILLLILSAAAVFGQSANVPKEATPKETNETAEFPLSYGLVIDNSGSFRVFLEELIESAKIVINSNNPDDETFIVRFVDSSKISLVQEFTSSKEELHSATDDLFIEGGQTAILDAVYFSAKHLASSETSPQNKRKILILITDGEDRKSAAKLDAVLKFLKDEKIQVYTLGFADGKVYKSLLEKLAKETGGKSFIAEKRIEIKATARQMTDALRAK